MAVLLVTLSDQESIDVPSTVAAVVIVFEWFSRCHQSQRDAASRHCVALETITNHGHGHPCVLTCTQCYIVFANFQLEAIVTMRPLALLGGFFYQAFRINILLISLNSTLEPIFQDLN